MNTFLNQFRALSDFSDDRSLSLSSSILSVLSLLKVQLFHMHHSHITSEDLALSDTLKQQLRSIMLDLMGFVASSSSPWVNEFTSLVRANSSTCFNYAMNIFYSPNTVLSDLAEAISRFSSKKAEEVSTSETVVLKLLASRAQDEMIVYRALNQDNAASEQTVQGLLALLLHQLSIEQRSIFKQPIEDHVANVNKLSSTYTQPLVIPASSPYLSVISLVQKHLILGLMNACSALVKSQATQLSTEEEQTRLATLSKYLLPITKWVEELISEATWVMENASQLYNTLRNQTSKDAESARYVFDYLIRQSVVYTLIRPLLVALSLLPKYHQSLKQHRDKQLDTGSIHTLVALGETNIDFR